MKAGISFGWADQQRAARQFHELLNVLNREKAISPADVARKAGLGGSNRTDSSKRLHTYRLPENAGGKRKAKTAKKPDKYFELARVVADLSGVSQEKILAQIFEGCSFGSIAAPVPDWETERWEALADLIEAMSTAVVFDTDLESYFRELAQTQVRYNIDDGSFDSGLWVSDTYGIEGGLAGNPIYLGEAPAVPSISIARKLIATPYDGEVQTVDGDEFEMKFEIYLDIRIALGPIAGGRKLGSLLEFRSSFDGVIGGPSGRRATFANPFTDGADEVCTLLIDGETVELVQLPSFLDVYDTAENREGADHAYFNWYEISPAILRDVLSGSSTSAVIQQLALNPTVGQKEIPSRFTKFSTADHVYLALMDGRLEAALKQQCESLTAGFRDFRKALRENIQSAESQARMNWRRPAGKDHKQDNQEE